MNSLAGHFLIASPHLADPNFVRTVTLLVQHTDEGALGLVLNRPTGKTVKDLWDEIGKVPCENELPVHLGGPVPGPLMALHTNREFSDMEVLPGVFLSTDEESLNVLVANEEPSLKLLAGNAGWGAGQLESEFDAGGWLTLPATSELIFYDGFDLWEKVAKQSGRATLRDMLDLKDMPDDPSVN